MSKFTQTSFGSGIMSGTMLGRMDDQAFRSGLKVCENFLVLPQGPIQNRAGTEFVREVKDSSRKVRLIPFVFANDQTMVLEVGAGYVRFHTNGQTLMNGASPYEVSTPFREEHIFELDYAQKEDVMTIVHPSYAPRELKRHSNLDWRLTTINFSPTLTPPTTVSAVKATTAQDETNADRYTFYYKVTSLNDDKTVESIASGAASCVANIYNTGTTIRVSWSAVSGAKFYRVYRNEGGVYSYVGETEDLSIIDDNLSPESDVTPPRYDDAFSTIRGISSITVTAGGSGYQSFENGISGGAVSSGLTGQLANKGSSRQIFFSNTSPDEIEARVIDSTGSGATISLITSTSTHTEEDGTDQGNTYTVTDTTVKGFTITNPGKGYSSSAYLRIGYFGSWKYDFYYHGLQVGTVRPYINIVDSTGSGATAEAVVTNGVITGINVISSGQNYSSPSVQISGTGTGATATATVSTSNLEYPTTVTYYEQRRVFGGTTNHPQRIVMSQSGYGTGMAYHIPSKDNDRVKFDIDSSTRNSIRHLMPLNRLIALAESGEFVVTSMNNDAITPSSASSKAHSYIGSTRVKPVVVGTSALYCAARGGFVREIMYNYNAGGYVPVDLSVRAADLFEYKTIKDMTFQQSPYPMAWFVSSDGSLLGLTYMPEQSVRAWHRHTTDGTFESCMCVAEGDYDILYVVVRREINGSLKRYIERFRTRKFNSRDEAFFVDCGSTYRGNETSTITGLSWLEGKTVNILADGAEHPQRVVTGGKVTLDAPAKIVHIGLPIEAVAETLPVYVPSKNDPSGLVSVPKKVNAIWARVLESAGDRVGPNDDALVEFKTRTTETPGAAPDLATGGIDVKLKPAWQNEATVRIVQSSPMPLTVLATCIDITVGG